MPIKTLGSLGKIRIGRVTGNTYFFFGLINQVSIHNFQHISLVLQIKRILIDLSEVTNKTKCEISARNVIAIRNYRHSNAS